MILFFLFLCSLYFTVLVFFFGIKMGKVNQLAVLMWKNFVLLKRTPVRTLFQVAWPLLSIIIVVLLTVFWSKSEHRSLVMYPAFEVNHLPGKLTTLKIAFAPDTSDVWDVMHKVEKKLSLKCEGFKREEDMVQALVSQEDRRNEKSKAQYLGGVVFNTSLNQKNIVYKIRLSSASANKQDASKEAKQEGPGSDPSAPWNTQFTFSVFEVPGPRNRNASHGGPPPYFESGFLSIQHALDSSIIGKLSGNDTWTGSLNTTVSVKRFPYPDYVHDKFILVIQKNLSWILMLSFICNPLNIVHDVVYEKEKKLKVGELV